MTVAKPLIMDGMVPRLISQGDVLAGAEIIAVLTTAGAGTLTAALLLSGILNRTGPAGAFNETTDSAANIINGLLGQAIYQATAVTGISSGAAVQLGTTVRLRYLNTVAFIGTLVAGAGVTLAGVTAVAASSFKDFLIIVTNGTPQQTFVANQVNASAIITGLTQFQTAQLSVGQLVTGTNIAASSTVVSIQPGIGVTLSAAVTATLANNALVFAPTVTIQGLGGGTL